MGWNEEKLRGTKAMFQVDAAIQESNSEKPDYYMLLVAMGKD